MVLSTVNYHFDMKDLEEASCILGIKLLRDPRDKILGLSQAVYIDKILVKFAIPSCRNSFLSF